MVFYGNKISNQFNSTLEVKTVGNYSVMAVNKNSLCISNFSEANITAKHTDAATIKIIQSESFSENAAITINVLNSSESSFEYQLDNKNFQNSNIFTDVSPGTHIVHIIDTKGCTDVSKEVIVVGYPKFFTPNGDGYHDTWNILKFDTVINERIYIFDRFGKLLKELDTKDAGWNGTYNGYQMPATDYWFKIIFTENEIEKEFRSHFSLKR